MRPEEIIKDNLSIIKHVHLKDCSNNNEWKEMGTGDIDFLYIVKILKDSDYNGWIMIEEETEEAAEDPNKVILNVRKYVEKNLKPIVN